MLLCYFFDCSAWKIAQWERPGRATVDAEESEPEKSRIRQWESLMVVGTCWSGVIFTPPFLTDSIDGSWLRERERELFARKDDLSGTRKWSKYSTWYMFIVGTGFLGDTWSVFSAQPQRQQTRISFVIIHLNQVLVSVQQPALHWDHGIGVGPVGSIVGWCHWMFCECTHSHLEDLLT